MGSSGTSRQHPKRDGVSRKRAVLRGLLLLVAVVVALVLVFWPGAGKPGARGILSVGGEQSVELPDPPRPVLLRWKFPPGQTLVYTLTKKETERLGQSTRVVNSSGTLTLRSLSDGRAEAELMLVQGKPGAGPPAVSAAAREQAGPPTGEESRGPGPLLAGTHPERSETEEQPPPSQPEGTSPGTPAPPRGAPAAPESPPLRQTLILDSRGRPVDAEVRAEVFLRILGVDFALPEEGLWKGSPVDTRRESALGMGATGLLTRRQTWTKTVERANYPCLRVEGQSYEDTSTPPQAGERILTIRKATSLCHFAYKQGCLAEWAVEREEEITSSGERGAKSRAGTILRSQDISLKLAEVRQGQP